MKENQRISRKQREAREEVFDEISKGLQKSLAEMQSFRNELAALDKFEYIKVKKAIEHAFWKVQEFRKENLLGLVKEGGKL